MEQEVGNREQKRVCFFSKSVKMKIAICEKNQGLLSRIKKQLYCYAESKRYDIAVDCYVCGEELLKSKTLYNIIFLGYNLAGENGLEIAKKLRESNNFSAIIFMSNYTGFVLESFKVKPYRFLVLPLKEGTIDSVLDDFFEEYSQNYPLWIKCGDDTVCLNMGDILYLEADNKHCIVHLEKEVLKCNRTMARVSTVLPRHCFGKINRAFIINFNHIRKYNSDCVSLTGGDSLHISRKYLNSFKEEYRTFLNPHIP